MGQEFKKIDAWFDFRLRAPLRVDIVLFASSCINNPSAWLKLRISFRKHAIRKQMFPKVAPDGSESSLMTLH